MRKFHTLLVLALVSAAVLGQGPDVIVGDLNGMGNYGTSGGIYAYSVGTTSCNIGNVWLNWIAGTNQHPVIGQAIYRIKNGRFEQIGFSWLKHGFFALSGNLCFNDCQGTDGTHLGVHCSDPYDAGLNGSQGNGPRSEVNAANGFFTYPPVLNPPVPTVIERRVQCPANDVNPALNAGATYLAEGHYVSPDDAAAGNDNNNASCRQVTFAAGSFNASFVGGTIQQIPAIVRWSQIDPTVAISYVDVLNDGRFIIAKKVTNLGGGNYHYEMAVHNLSSDRSGRGFTVNFPAGTVISNAGDKFAPHHSGEVYSNALWTNTINANSVNWATQLATVNINASALRFGTTHTFWFDATAATETSTQIELFKPEPCPTEPIVTPANSYALNPAAPFDDPTITGANGPGSDDSQLTVNLGGFTFNYWGTNYTQVSICSNGFLQFGGSSTQYANACIPAAGAPNGIIAGYWDDLLPSPGQIKYQTIGSAPNRRFVAWWNNVPLYNNPGTTQSLKIILDETTNKITSTIITTGEGGLNATRGIENQTGISGVGASCNTPGSAVAGTSQTYTPTSAILPSANLTVTSNTAPGGWITWSINSVAKSAPVVLVASLDPGPLNLGPLGILNVGLTPGLYAVIADGAGALGPPNPAAFTDWYCGDWSFTLQLPAGLPGGLIINSQGVVISPASIPPPPNGQFHITTPVTTNT